MRIEETIAEVARRSAKAKFITPPTVGDCYFRARLDLPDEFDESGNLFAPVRCSGWSDPSFGHKVCDIPPGGWFGPALEVWVQDLMPNGMKGLVVKVPLPANDTAAGDDAPLDVWVNICCEEVQFATQEFRMGPAPLGFESAIARSADWPALSDSPSEALLYHLQNSMVGFTETPVIVHMSRRRQTFLCGR